MRTFLLLLPLSLTLGCAEAIEGNTARCDPEADTDGDGLDDCTEGEELGTSFAHADTDGDGVDDGDEVAQGTDPNDPDTDGDGIDDGEDDDPLTADGGGGNNGGGNNNGGDDPPEYYDCGWLKNDPGDLQSTGNREGDVIADITLVDQCGEDVSIWDMYGEYHVLYMTAAW